MSTFNRGPNAGISGIVEFPTVASGQWHLRVYLIGDEWNLGLLDDTGRGDGDWGAQLPGIASGIVTLKGKVSREAVPNPTTFNGAIGTLTSVYYTKPNGAEVKTTAQVRVFKRGVSFVEKDADNYDITLTCQINAMPEASGWPGTQPVPPEEDFPDKVLWASLGFTRDPNILQESASFRLRTWGVDDSNAAEVAEIESHFNQTAPASRMKLRGITSSRGGPHVLYLDFAWGLTDTVEDRENPGTIARIDNIGIESSGQDTNVYGGNEPVDAPTPHSSLKSVAHSIQEINDLRSQKVTYFDVNDSAEKWLFARTRFVADPSLITNLTIKGAVFIRQDGSPPAPGATGLVLNHTELFDITSPDTSDLKGILWFYGETTSADDVLFPKLQTVTDPNQLTSEKITGVIFTTSAPPNDPIAPTDPPGLTLRDKLDVPLTDAAASNKSMRLYRWGLRDTKADIEYPGSPKDTEVSHVSDEATLTFVTASPTPPNAPAVPTGSDGIGLGQLLETKTVRENDGRWRHSFTYGNTTDFQKIAFPKSQFNNDPADIENHEEIAVPHDRLTPPPATPTPQNTALKYRARHGFRVAGTPEKWLHVFEFDHNTTQDDIELPKTHTTSTVDDMAETAEITQVTNSATPPAAPAAPVGQLVETETQPLKAVNGTAYLGRWAHTFRYGPNTKTQDIEFAADAEVDASALTDEQEMPVVNTSSTPPATPTPGNTDLKFVRRKSRRLQGTVEKWKHVFFFARNTNQDEIELRGTNKHDDPNNIDESAEITQVTSSATPPTTPAAPLGSLNEIVSQPLKAPNGTYTGRWSHTWKYDSTTNLQKITNQGDIDNDVAALKSEDVQTLFSAVSSPAPPDPATRVTGTKVIRRVARRIVGTPAGWQHQYFYGYWDEKDRIENTGTWQKIDPNNLDSDSRITLVRTTTPADPTPPVGCKIISRDQKALPNGFIEYSFTAANLDSLDRVKLPKFKTVIDPNGIDDSAVRIREWFTNGTAPANPTNPPTNNVKLIGTTDLTLSPAVGSSPGTNLRVWLYGAKDSADEIVLPKYRTEVDPSGLETSAIRAQLDTAPPVDPALIALNLQVVNTITVRVTLGLAVDHNLVIVVYALVTNQQKVEQAGTVAVTTPLTVYRRRTTTVVPVTGTAAAMASAALIAAANIGDVTFERCTVQLLNNQKARQTIETTGEDKKIHSASWRTGLESMRAIATAGVGLPGCIVHVIVPGPVTGVLYTQGTIVPVEIYRTRGRFLFRRRFITATPESYDWPGSIGAVNAAAFLGYPAKTIMFGGTLRQYCYAIPGTPAHLLVVDYVFQYDSHSWVNFSSVPYGRVFTRNGAGGPPASGYVDPTLYDQNAKAEWPAINDFTIFTTP